jgi:hypothetical protein
MNAVNNLIEKYLQKDDGIIETIKEGCLLDYGIAIASASGYKSCIIKETYINSWSSLYSIKMYNKLPKKYETMIQNYYDELYSEEVIKI